MSEGPIRPGALRPNEAAAYIGLTKRFLEVRRQRGGGPPFVKVSARNVVYRVADLDRWMAERVRASTSDSGQ